MLESCPEVTDKDGQKQICEIEKGNRGSIPKLEDGTGTVVSVTWVTRTALAKAETDRACREKEREREEWELRYRYRHRYSSPTSHHHRHPAQLLPLPTACPASLWCCLYFCCCCCCCWVCRQWAAQSAHPLACLFCKFVSAAEICWLNFSGATAFDYNDDDDDDMQPRPR